MTEFRLDAFRKFMKMPMPKFGPSLKDIDFSTYTYFTRVSGKETNKWEEVPETVKNTFTKLGIPEAEAKFLAGASTQYESEVVYHNMLKEVEEKGVIFLSSDMGLRMFPDLFKISFALSQPIKAQ